MKNGEIAEYGTYTHLKSQNGEFKQLLESHNFQVDTNTNSEEAKVQLIELATTPKATEKIEGSGIVKPQEIQTPGQLDFTNANKNVNASSENKTLAAETAAKNGILHKREGKSEGAVGFRVYKNFFSYGGKSLGIVALFFFLISNVTFISKL